MANQLTIKSTSKLQLPAVAQADGHAEQLCSQLCFCAAGPGMRSTACLHNSCAAKGPQHQLQPPELLQPTHRPAELTVC